MHRFVIPIVCLATAMAGIPIQAQAGAAPPTPAVPGSVSATAGLESSGILDDDPAPILGYGLAEAISRFGPPSSVRTARGGEAWQDDVAFIYRSGYSLFWYGDRLWQLRFTAPYGGTIYGLFLGDPSSKAYSILGQPYETKDDKLVYRLPYRGYPVRLSLVFTADRLSDVYLYRADY